MNTGGWVIEVKDKYPQAIATAISGLNFVGAEYEPIALIGTQIANGTNYAVLAEQTIVTGKDTKNIVLLIFNKKPNDINATLVSIERIVESGADIGGIKVDGSLKIPQEPQVAWGDAFSGFVGSKVEPLYYVGSQVTKGTNYIYIGVITPTYMEAKEQIAVITINTLTKQVTFGNILGNKQESSLGYAFTW